MKKAFLKIILYVFGVSGVLVGILAVVFGYGHTRDAKASESWPLVQGIVAESYEDVQTSTHSSGSGRSTTMTSYVPTVRYNYQVDGQAYSNDLITYASKNTANRDYAQQVLKKYPKNANVDVYYNPQKPESSVLEPGAHSSSALWLILGLVMFVSGAAQIFLAYKVIDNIQVY